MVIFPVTRKITCSNVMQLDPETAGIGEDVSARSLIFWPANQKAARDALALTGAEDTVFFPTERPGPARAGSGGVRSSAPCRSVRDLPVQKHSFGCAMKGKGTVTTHPPTTPQNPPSPPPDPGQQIDPAALVAPSTAAAPAPLPADDQVRAWSAVAVMVLVLGSACAMLLTGQPVNDALMLAGGVTLLGVGVARRAVTDGGLPATIAITGAVTTFAVVLLIRGYEIADVAIVSGGAGLIAGEVTAWVLRTCTLRRGV